MNSFVKARSLYKGNIDKKQIAELARLPTGKAFPVPEAAGYHQNTSKQKNVASTQNQDDYLDGDDSIFSDSEIKTSETAAAFASNNRVNASNRDNEVDFTLLERQLSHKHISNDDQTYAHFLQHAKSRQAMGNQPTVDPRDLAESVSSYPTTTSGLESVDQDQEDEQTETVQVPRKTSFSNLSSHQTNHFPSNTTASIAPTQSYPQQSVTTQTTPNARKRNIQQLQQAPNPPQHTSVHQALHHTEFPQTTSYSHAPPSSTRTTQNNLPIRSDPTGPPSTPPPPTHSRIQLQASSSQPHHQQQAQQQQPEDPLSEIDLTNLTYPFLANEPFSPTSTPPTEQPNLDESHLLTLLTAPESTQLAYLTATSLPSWTAIGEWIAQRELELREALVRNRAARREVAARFEVEIGKRRDGVKGMIENLDRRLEVMRAQGGRVVEGGRAKGGL